MKIGVFGGTFDPPHIGHLILADEACTQLDLNCVLWMPTAIPPHKLEFDVTDIQKRLDLVRSAINYDSRFKISRIEVDRPPPLYAVDTMMILRQTHPLDEFIYLMGGDSLKNLYKWHKPQQFAELCYALGVLPRIGEKIDLATIENHIPGIRHKIIFIKSPAIDISGSEIRSRIKEGRSYRYYLPALVYEVIEEQQLYR